MPLIRSALAALLATSALAEAPRPDIIFHIPNDAPPDRIAADPWAQAVAQQPVSDRIQTIFDADSDRIVADIRTANRGESRQTVLVLHGALVDADLFQPRANRLESLIRQDPSQAATAVLLDTPTCRVLQGPLHPREYAPKHTIIAPTDPALLTDCYAKAIEMFINRSHGTDLNADGDPVIAVDTTAAAAQAAMPQMSRYGHKFFDQTEDGTKTDRHNNIFAPGEPIRTEIAVDYVTRDNPGHPGARYRIGLDIEIYDAENTLLDRNEGATIYEGEMRHRVPVDAEYFRNFTTAGLFLEEHGNYQIVFILTDLMREDAVPLRVGIPVRVGLEPDLIAAATEDGKTQREHAPDPLDNYTLRRCAALFQSRVETVGRANLGEETFTEIDAKVRHFLEADILLQTQFENLPMDLATDRTLSAMHAISRLYQDRMKTNIETGAHPWEGDRLMERDLVACNHIFDTRPNR